MGSRSKPLVNKKHPGRATSIILYSTPRRSLTVQPDGDSSAVTHMHVYSDAFLVTSRSFRIFGWRCVSLITRTCHDRWLYHMNVAMPYACVCGGAWVRCISNMKHAPDINERPFGIRNLLAGSNDEGVPSTDTSATEGSSPSSRRLQDDGDTVVRVEAGVWVFESEGGIDRCECVGPIPWFSRFLRHP